MKQHVALGDLIVRDLPDLVEIRAGIRHHHERWDGKGYLHGLAGDDIPEVARILAVCDAFSAMTTTRPYRKALSVDEALTRLEDACGSQLDERLVIAFVNGIRTVATRADARGRADRPLDAGSHRSSGPVARSPEVPATLHLRDAGASRWSSRSPSLVAALVLPPIGLAAAPPDLGRADGLRHRRQHDDHEHRRQPHRREPRARRAIGDRAGRRRHRPQRHRQRRGRACRRRRA